LGNPLFGPVRLGVVIFSKVEISLNKKSKRESENVGFQSTTLSDVNVALMVLLGELIVTELLVKDGEGKQWLYNIATRGLKRMGPETFGDLTDFKVASKVYSVPNWMFKGLVPQKAEIVSVVAFQPTTVFWDKMFETTSFSCPAKPSSPMITVRLFTSTGSDSSSLNLTVTVCSVSD
jgi:hypothetical protein